MILDGNGMPVLQPLVDNASTATFNTAFAAIGTKTSANYKATSPSVGSQAERDSIFPSPVQGNRVYRRDVGWEEAYFGVYNSTTNFGGAAVAGWYPIAGKLPYSQFKRETSATVTTAQNAFSFTSVSSYGTSSSSTAAQIIYPGRYLVNASVTAGNGGDAMVYAAIRKNGAGSGGGGLAFGAAQQTPTRFNTIGISATESFVAGDSITFNVWGSVTLSTGSYASRMDVQYIGPA